MANQIYLFKKKKPINKDSLQNEVNVINKKRKANKQPLITKIKVRCRRATGKCKIYGIAEG